MILTSTTTQQTFVTVPIEVFEELIKQLKKQEETLKKIANIVDGNGFLSRDAAAAYMGFKKVTNFDFHVRSGLIKKYKLKGLPASHPRYRISDLENALEHIPVK